VKDQEKQAENIKWQSKEAWN